MLYNMKLFSLPQKRRSGVTHFQNNCESPTEKKLYEVDGHFEDYESFMNPTFHSQ